MRFANRRSFRLVSIITVAVLLLSPSAAEAAIGPPAVISNGTIELGIQPEGNLIVGERGLAFLPTGNESLAPGCACEGWGVADVGSGVTGYASESNGQANVSVVDFTTTASTATSVVVIPAQGPVLTAGGAGSPTFEVTHTFTPAAETPFLYRLQVQVKNTSAIGATDLRYRRVMDWDVEPTPFEEFVTNEPGNATNLIHLSNDGFETPDPLKPNTASSNEVDPYAEGRLVDYGPADHGSLWDFSFGPLAAGATKDFTIFYGAAPTEDQAFDALEAVGAEAFSLGQANTDNKPPIGGGGRTVARQGVAAGPVRPANEIDGAPATFIFAFEGIGGAPVFGSQYVMVAKDGGVFAPGGQGFHGTAGVRPGDGILRNARGQIIGASGSPLDSPVVAFAYTPTRQGYWLVQANGGVIPIGDAPDVGNLKGVNLKRPIVGAAATEAGGGLYLVAGDGGIFALGEAPFKGRLGGVPLNKPIVGMDVDADGSGYFLVASDGGIFAFDALFRGSLGALPLNRPIVDMAVYGDGSYVLAASDGGVFAFGAAFRGSLGGISLVAPIVGIAADPDGSGYWMAGADGGAFAFGAEFFGSLAPVLLNSPMTGIAAL